ncbi:MAG: arginine deiminase-related protein [Deltaproteobacteria bacterium]|nr:arginine deiminase-related protein [Deltaproteobacteria bacterium]
MRLLMCSPEYYGIEYEINPWMSRSRQADARLAREQWNRLHRLLREELAAEVETIAPVQRLPDMVFTANAGLAWNGKFVASNFRHEVRRREAAHYESWFSQQGFDVLRLPEEYYFEGEGDLLKCGDSWFAGYHIRTDILSHQKVAEIIEQEILSLELTNDWFYHLDTCFCPLSFGQAMFYPPAFDSYALKVLENHIPELIPVSAQEAARFACNAVVLDNKIAISDGCPELRQRLESAGFTLFETPLGEFVKAGGSAKCLVLKIG